ncbi:calcium uniporter protein, mitochondrial [Lingula anatina]|uniref:Calcium uniporter protein n=1 Tax=Lingula anatina TaxID=7574 RepID=A0A1S3IDI2_LINAN|nr:calcium uniporter protein, mitochondrial [Lingula anatina]|eukprot:XP_013396218.1 calcium uniporter protein, mitochondrial [Lingula anatina]
MVVTSALRLSRAVLSLNTSGVTAGFLNREVSFYGLASCILSQNNFSTRTALYKNDVNVVYEHGLPVISVPMPSRQELCRFPLKPVSSTVGDFIDAVQEEDGGIDRAALYTSDGTRIARATTIDVLMRSPFKLMINDLTYEVEPPELSDIPSEDLTKLADAKHLIAQLYSTLNIQDYQVQKEKELLQKLEDLKTEIQPLENMKLEIMAKAESQTNRMSWGLLMYMGLQFGFLARLTWWEYSWDIIEPVTYFVTYGTAIVFYAYYVATKQEYNVGEMYNRQRLLSFHKDAGKKQFDVEKYNKLRKAILQAELDIERLRDPLQLQLPIPTLEAKREE